MSRSMGALLNCTIDYQYRTFRLLYMDTDSRCC